MNLSALNAYLPKNALVHKKIDDFWKVKKIAEAALEFESQFLSLMIENMFTGFEADGMFGGGHSETIYRTFMADEYAKSIAESGGVGIADSVREQLLEIQEMEDTISGGGNA